MALNMVPNRPNHMYLWIFYDTDAAIISILQRNWMKAQKGSVILTRSHNQCVSQDSKSGKSSSKVCTSNHYALLE